MHVIAVHDIKDPAGFGAAVGPTLEKIPAGMTLHSMCIPVRTARKRFALGGRIRRGRSVVRCRGHWRPQPR